MITKQRLQELIEQGATIYSKYRSYLLKNEKEHKLDFWYKRIVEIKDNKLHYIYEDSDYYEDFDYLIALEELFETEEDARWELEMTATRTETLKMPNWEELQKAIKQVKDAGNSMYFYYSMFFYKKDYKPNSENTISFYIRDNNHIVIDDDDICLRLFEKPLTKENYIEACRLCKKLFIGEEV